MIKSETLIVPMLVTFILLSLFLFMIVVDLGKNQKDNTLHKYKVKELERNTVFTIQEQDTLYKVGDTVWVNTNTRKIDPVDSVAMRCVITNKE